MCGNTGCCCWCWDCGGDGCALMFSPLAFDEAGVSCWCCRVESDELEPLLEAPGGGGAALTGCIPRGVEKMLGSFEDEAERGIGGGALGFSKLCSTLRGNLGEVGEEPAPAL